jgi:hypothetical protein
MVYYMQKKRDRIGHLKQGFRRITVLLALAAGVFCACFCVLSVADKAHDAQYRLSIYKEELQGWEACRSTKPAFYRANLETVSNCLNSLSKAQEDFWVSVPKRELIGLYILAGMGGLAGGYLATWTVVWFGGLAIGKSIRRMVCGVRHNTHKQLAS